MTSTIPYVSLPWYDLAEVREANDALWAALAVRLAEEGVAEVPPRLDRRTAYEGQWRSGRLLFSQCCGYDVILTGRDHLRLVATPRFTAPGCRGAEYSSFVLVREACRALRLEDLRDARCVINTTTSHSGMNILFSLVAPLHERGRFFSRVDVSGSHVRSLAALRTGEADVAAIDCVVHAMLERDRPESLRGTRLLCRTESVPAPPYVTRASASDEQVDAIRRALARVLCDAALAHVRRRLFLAGVEVLPLSAYQPIADLEQRAREQGFRGIGA